MAKVYSTMPRAPWPTDRASELLASTPTTITFDLGYHRPYVRLQQRLADHRPQVSARLDGLHLKLCEAVIVGELPAPIVCSLSGIALNAGSGEDMASCAIIISVLGFEDVRSCWAPRKAELRGER